MNKIITLPIIILFSMLNTSCDPMLINEFAIENKSEYDLNICLQFNKDVRNTNKDSLIKIKIGKSKLLEIGNYGEIGTSYDKGEKFLEFIDYLTIEHNTITIKKDITNRANWKYIIINNSIFGKHKVQYLLTIENKDF